MDENRKVVRLCQPEEIDDPLTAILRAGARRLLEQAIEAEVDTFLASMKAVTLPDGRNRMVRHGHGPERMIQTGVGPVPVRRAKVRDRDGAEAGERVRFTSSLLPRWARRTKSLDALLPVLDRKRYERTLLFESGSVTEIARGFTGHGGYDGGRRQTSSQA